MNMATVVFINRLQPADGQRDALIGLQREFADSIHADPESLHYSVHEPIDDEAAPLTVIQAYTSVAGFEKHGEWMAPNIPRLVALLASPPDPPVLLRLVSLGGDRKESFSA
jgi:quinol monooxygenase YgiN